MAQTAVNIKPTHQRIAMLMSDCISYCSTTDRILSFLSIFDRRSGGISIYVKNNTPSYTGTPIQILLGGGASFIIFILPPILLCKKK